MKYTEEEEYAIGYYMDKEICAEIEIKDDKGEFLKALGINTEDSNFESHLIRFKTLLNLIEKQRKEIEKCKIAFDAQVEALIKMTNVYNSLYNKIKEKIKEIDENGYWDFLEERDYEKTIGILKEILGDE